VEFRPAEGLFANLHYNPKHALAEQLAWDAENNPRNVGFSHNVLARLTREDGQAVVEEITHVQSVDLVADPAATQGLFEQHAVDQSSGELAATDPTLEDRVERLQAQLSEAAARESSLRRQLKIRDALEAHGVRAAGAKSIVETLGRTFYNLLLAVDDERQVDALIAEQAERLGRSAASAESSGERPRSQELQATLARLGGRATTAAEFARALRLRGGSPSP
jgi:hypothetical protein